LSVVEIERSVELKEARIILALPKGIRMFAVTLAGVPPVNGGGMLSMAKGGQK
jgi:hypothetical protein